MVLLRIILGIVVFVIAVKLLAILLAIVGFALHFIWIAVVLGFFALIGWVIYKIISPSRPAQV